MNKPKTAEEWAEWAVTKTERQSIANIEPYWNFVEALRLYGEQVREETIDECARVAADEVCAYCDIETPRAIRALKEKK